MTSQLSGDRRFSQEAWLGLLSQRLAALPGEATLEEEAELLANFGDEYAAYVRETDAVIPNGW